MRRHVLRTLGALLALLAGACGVAPQAERRPAPPPAPDASVPARAGGTEPDGVELSRDATAPDATDPGPAAPAPDPLERAFRDLPMAARRLTGPLFWLHGDESKERLEECLLKVAEGGNGCFTAESRPHNDWLGEGWYRDLEICLEAAKRLDLKMWIFDERWWPSQMVGGKVPPEYGTKTLQASAETVEGPRRYAASGCGGARFIGAVAGRETGGAVDGASLVDIAPHVRDGELAWDVPEGRWRVMRFSWELTGARGLQKQWVSVDGASADCVEWFIKTVYQPHHERFGADFGKTIVGYFYDEPETQGDWGSDVMAVLAERGVDWKKALVAWKFRLAGEEQIAARYQYCDAFAEAWGRTMYGGMARWCREHDVVSMGHFMEHGTDLYSRGLCAGNMFQLQKYSDMGGIDLVCRQYYPGDRKTGLFQMPKLGSSISHVYGKADDLTMCEIFGAYGQDITYAQMKWLTDQMQVRGVNFMVPHSFNPRAPHDTDCPPYFYNGGREPRWPLYRVYADYTSRLSLMLSGGRHVAPVAFLFLGQSYHAGRRIRPDEMTNSLDDALFDCDWMPYDVFEEGAKLEGGEIALHRERYRVLVVPAAEVIPYATLEKAKRFFDGGGIVVGYGMLPTRSATLGKTSADIARLREAVWGPSPAPATTACRTSAGGGRAYFLPEKPTPAEVRACLTGDAGLRPDLEVMEGETHDWLHVLHRVKEKRDVFLVCNQDHVRAAKRFRLRVRAKGEPECWDAMRNEITSIPYDRVDAGTVDVDITLEPMESALLVFNQKERDLPARIAPGAEPLRAPIEIVREAAANITAPDVADPTRGLEGCAWVWHPKGDAMRETAGAVRRFRATVDLPRGRRVARGEFLLSADNRFALFVNGRKAGGSAGGESWRTPLALDVADSLREGGNVLAIKATNGGDSPNPAGLVGRLLVEFDEGEPSVARIDTSWRATDREEPGWERPGFDDSAWPAAKEVARFGAGPWGRLGGAATTSPLAADPFRGRATVPEEVDLAACRVYLEMDGLPAPELAAAVQVNGAYAGGVIGGPFRLEVTRLLRKGENVVKIEPVAPKAARLVVY